MKLSIIIPVYNEENHIEQVLENVYNLNLSIHKEIIIIDDASSDKTCKILDKYKNKKFTKIIKLFKNRGKGYAIRQGLEEVRGDIVLIQDADLEYSVKDYPEILKPLIKNQSDVVYGSRFLGEISNMKWQNWLANKILTLTTNILYGIRLSDEATAYKAFRTKILKNVNLKCERFEFCPEITAKLAKKGYKIYEVPITYKARDNRTGKKIKIKDAFYCFWTLIKYRFKD